MRKIDIKTAKKEVSEFVQKLGLRQNKINKLKTVIEDIAEMLSYGYVEVKDNRIVYNLETPLISNDESVAFKNKRYTVKDVKVTTGFGEFSVSDSVLRYFEILLRKAKRDNALVVSIKDSSGNILEVTPEALENIIHAIEDYVIILVEKKFTKEHEIASSETPWEIDIKNTFR